MSFHLLNTECFILSGISDGKGLATMVWFEKNYIHPHDFRLTLVHSRSISNSVYDASHKLEIQREWHCI